MTRIKVGMKRIGEIDLFQILINPVWIRVIRVRFYGPGASARYPSRRNQMPRTTNSSALAMGR